MFDFLRQELKAKEKRMEELNAEAKALDRDTSSSSSSSSDSSDDDDPDKIVAAKVRVSLIRFLKFSMVSNG